MVSPAASQSCNGNASNLRSVRFFAMTAVRSLEGEGRLKKGPIRRGPPARESLKQARRQSLAPFLRGILCLRSSLHGPQEWTAFPMWFFRKVELPLLWSEIARQSLARFCDQDVAGQG